MNQNRRTLLIAATALPLTGIASLATAQQPYPNGPIRLIVPFPPAGGTDLVSRLTAHAITEATAWNIVIENRPGAGGGIGLNVVGKADPNGQTLGMAQTSNMAINPTLYKSLPYDALKDFTPIGLVAAQPVILVVRNESKYHSLADLISDAKSKPDTLTMASSGSGTVTHLAGEMLAKRAGVKFVHIPYKGAAPSLNDLMGGQVDFAFAAAPSVIGFLRSDKLRALAVTSLERLKVLSNTPTVAESGYKDFVAEDWKALVGPAGIPAPIVEKLNAALNTALKNPELSEKLANEGSRAVGGTSQRFAEFLKSEHAHWGDVVRASGAKVD